MTCPGHGTTLNSKGTCHKCYVREYSKRKYHNKHGKFPFYIIDYTPDDSRNQITGGDKHFEHKRFGQR